MDFWSRLIAGTSLSSPAKKGPSNNPDIRLAGFKREYSQLLQIWRNASNLTRDPDAVEDIRGSIQELTSILSDETRRPSPHLCISFAASKQLYIPIGKIATTSYNESIIREAVAFFTTLIESEEEDFVENNAFSKSLMNLLVRITGANSIRLSSDTEVEVVELAFSIAAKIRLQPEILSAWFTAHEGELDGGYKDAQHKFVGKTHKEDFPLFYLLIDCIHQEGRIGDFARTGLLYIIETASTSVALEQWLVESDLATLMATGLGALYSQLSRKLVIDHTQDNLPAVLVFSDYQPAFTNKEIISSASPDFQAQMDTFLSHLIFWQDVLEHCNSVEVKQTLLEHFQVIFLQQLLYPSLLESSDIDGGSSVAVLTYLRRILESLDHPDMIHLILHYLLALPDTTPIKTSGSRASVSAARKRKSMDLASMVALQSDLQTTPSLFNLVDLILGSLRSHNQQTIAVTLQLVSVILRRHHRYAVSTLWRTRRVSSMEARRTIGVHEKEMKFLLTLAGEIGGDENFDEVYENHVKDSMASLESHPCSQVLIAPMLLNDSAKLPGAQASIPGGPRQVNPHTLRPDDPMMKQILEIMESFFVNLIETNLCVTETIFDLATCGFMSLDGWLLPDQSEYSFLDDDEEEALDLSASVLLTSNSLVHQEARQLQAVRRARQQPIWPPPDLPPLLVQLEILVSHISSYRKTIPRFEDLLSQRRQAFHSSSAIQPLKVLQKQDKVTRSSFDSSNGSRSASPPAEKQSAFDSLAQRIFPEFATPSRRQSPRGRRSQDYSRYGLGSNSASSPAPKSNGLPGEFPRSNNSESKSRGNSRAFSPSPLRHPEATRAVSGQEAAFKEVERSILARKVGVPGWKKSDVVPFPNLIENKKGENINTGGSDDEEVENREEEVEKTATVSHVLTNVIVLQDFLLELASLVQVRTGLFAEAKFG